MKLRAPNRKTIYGSLILTLAGVVLILFFKFTDDGAVTRLGIKETEESAGDVDDPNARWRYEFMRLRDPKTEQIPQGIRQKELEFAATLPTRGLVMNLGKGVGTVQSATWNQRGPYNVGGRTRALAIDVTNENVILAGGASGGMWRSTDGGASWNRATSKAMNVQSVTCLAQDTRAGKTNIWYYGTGEYEGNSAGELVSAMYRGDGIFKTTDGGSAWNVLAATSVNTPQSFTGLFEYVWNIVTDPSSGPASDKIYAATYGAIYRSTDGGNTWKYYLGGYQSTYSIYTDIAISSVGVLYASLSSGGPQQGIWRSVDGTTWTNITPVGWPASYKRTVLAIASSNQNVVYFLSETPGGGLNNHSLWKYTYISGNGSGSGGAWQNRSSALPAFGGKHGNFGSQSSYDLVVKVKPDNENCVFIGGTSLFRSTDGFATTENTNWIGGYVDANSSSEIPNHHCDQHSLVFFPSNPTKMLSGHDGGISLTLNNLSSTTAWTSVNNGYFTTQFYTVSVEHGTAGDPLVIGGMQDNGTWMTTSTNGYGAWVRAYGGDGSYCQVAAGKSFYLVSSQNGFACRTALDAVGNWTNWTRLDPSGVPDSVYLFINPFLMDPNNSKLIYLAGGDRIWRNSDVTTIPAYSNNKASTNWSQLSNSVVSGSTISALGISKSPANRLYYGTWNGKLFRIDGANIGDPVRTDIGIGKGLPLNAYVSCIAVDQSDYNKAILVLSNYNIQSLFYTTDAGNTWQAISGNLEQYADGTGNGPSCRWVSMLPIGSSTMYFVGTSTGLYSTTSLNGSSTVWVQEGPSTIGNVVVDMIDTRAVDGLVVAATHANGVFSANLAVPPAIPVIAYPLAGTTGVAIRPRLFWNSVYGATSYNVQISASSSFSSLVVNQFGITDTSLASAALTGNTTYYWRVSASNSAGTSQYSLPGSFTTIIAAPGLPTLTSPSNAATNVSIAPTLTWTASSGATTYRLQIATDSSFVTTILNDSTLATTQRQVGPLTNGVKYYWRVNATNVAGTSLYSTVWNFTTVIAAPQAPLLLSPQDGMINASLDPVLTWNAVGGSTSYQLQLSTIPAFTSNVVDDSTISSTSRSVGPLSLATVYFWRVRAKNDGGYGPFATSRQFRTILTTLVEQLGSNIPKDFALSQNYPNPFNPATTIQFALPKSIQVTLKVFDALGKEVATLVTQELGPGYYSVRWRAGVPSGAYIYRLQAGEYVETKKMIILR